MKRGIGNKPQLERAAIGVRAHSGWAAVVAVTGDLGSPGILDRRRISVTDPDSRGFGQPYHFAKTLALKDAEIHLARCAGTARRLAFDGLGALAAKLRDSGCEVAAAAILAASGRPIPSLAETLASHAMIHTAEGEFFRNAFSDACDQLGIPVCRIRERELLDRAAKEFKLGRLKVKTRLNQLGRALGPPWSQDQKSAALAAWLGLSVCDAVSRS